MFLFNQCIYYLLFFVILSHYSAQANVCANIFKKISKNFKKSEIKTSVLTPEPIPFFTSDPQIFAEQITKGMLLRKGQDDLFKFYITHFFPYSVKVDISLQKVFDFLKKYNKFNLSKLPLREQIIHFIGYKKYIPDHLKDVINSFRKTSSQIRNNLFQIEANYGFWTKLLDFPLIKVDPFLNKKQQAETNKNNFINYLNTTALNKTVRDFIKDTSQDYQERTIALYQALDKIKKSLPNNHKSKDHKISQLMVELVHTTGFGNQLLTEGFKSQDTTHIIETVKQIFKERNWIAQRLGFSNFVELKNSLNGKTPDILHQLEEISDSMIKTTNIIEKFLRLRTLSIQESPYRSCLSRDCASDFYFERALDPNYIYWTLTDNKNRSSGHVVIVLGTARNRLLSRVKTALVDKIQNVPVHQISAVLEGISLSLKEQDYRLALPVLVGRENDLSNDLHIRFYVTSNIVFKLQNKLNSFKPHYHNVSSSSGYSRADNRLNLLEWKDIKLYNVQISPGDFPVSKVADEKLTIKLFSN